jgi:transcriptional regulator with XRE-family HTH domain
MNLNDKKFLLDLGHRLRECRSASGLTQAEMAAKSGLHRTFIGSVERGERNLSILNLRELARVLRTPIAALLNDLK